MSTIPFSKNKILIRFENIADFTNSTNSSKTVDLSQIAISLFNSANKDQIFEDVTPKIQEMTLTGNMLIQDMWDKKIQWKTKDDQALGR